ncbi:MAG TPA: 50S ribosomal protein L35 [Candidatus Peregrinibacteria bacterium]|nr:50S ribosomal protein L35 [Candidatus Peregrinibacteria bacterium]
MKAKNRSSVKKRVRFTGTGKIKIQKSCRNHLLMQKSKRQKNLGKHPTDLSSGDKGRVRKCLPAS